MVRTRARGRHYLKLIVLSHAAVARCHRKRSTAILTARREGKESLGADYGEATRVQS